MYSNQDVKNEKEFNELGQVDMGDTSKGLEIIFEVIEFVSWTYLHIKVVCKEYGEYWEIEILSNHRSVKL